MVRGGRATVVGLSATVTSRWSIVQFNYQKQFSHDMCKFSRKAQFTDHDSLRKNIDLAMEHTIIKLDEH